MTVSDISKSVLHPQPENPLRDPRLNVEINVGKACNNRCVFCLDGMPKKEDRSYMDFELMKSELDSWYQAGRRSVGFLGGEPTTYPKIVQSVQYASRLGFTRIAVATNAIKFRRARFTDKMIAAGLTRVTVSMHGHTAELEDRLTRVPGNFKMKTEALRILVEHQRAGNLPDGLSVNIVLNGWNYHKLPNMLRFFFDKVGLDDIRVNFVRPEGYAEGSKDLTPRYAVATPYLLKAILLNEFHFKKQFSFGGFPMCVLPARLLSSKSLLRKYMGEYRDLSTDCSIRGEGEKDGVVKLSNGRARFNWQDRKRFDLKGKMKACQSCSLSDVCEGVWQNYIDIWGDSEFQPIL